MEIQHTWRRGGVVVRRVNFISEGRCHNVECRYMYNDETMKLAALSEVRLWMNVPNKKY